MEDKSVVFYKEAFEEMNKETPDITKAYNLLVESYDMGNHKAAYALGTWYLHGKHVKVDLKKAIDLFNYATKTNIPEACFDLAVCYEKGTGVKIDLEKAFELYMRAALFGDSQSFYEVGRCYYHGVGIQQNERLANIWLDKAEELGVKE